MFGLASDVNVNETTKSLNLGSRKILFVCIIYLVHEDSMNGLNLRPFVELSYFMAL